MVMLGKPGFFICSSPFENLVTHSWCQLWLEGGWYLFDEESSYLQRRSDSAFCNALRAELGF